MRSLLFVPADGGSKLEKAMASGTDSVIIDLEDSITPERKSFARAATLEFLRQASATKQRPRLLVRVNGLDTGMTDADLEAVVPGPPDAIVFPKAEGAPSVVHLDAKLTAREAVAGLPEGQIKIVELNDGGVGRDASELLRKVKAAQYVAAHPGQVCPAKWKEGEATLAPSLDLVGKI